MTYQEATDKCNDYQYLFGTPMTCLGEDAPNITHLLISSFAEIKDFVSGISTTNLKSGRKLLTTVENKASDFEIFFLSYNSFSGNRFYLELEKYLGN